MKLLWQMSWCYLEGVANTIRVEHFMYLWFNRPQIAYLITSYSINYERFRQRAFVIASRIPHM